MKRLRHYRFVSYVVAITISCVLTTFFMTVSIDFRWKCQGLGCQQVNYDQALYQQELAKSAENQDPLQFIEQNSKDLDVVETKVSISKKSDMIIPKTTPSPKDLLIEKLRVELVKHLMDAKATKAIPITFKTCKEHNITNYDDTCHSNRTKCLKHHIPDNLTERLENLVFSNNMQSMPDRYLDIMQSMRDKLTTKQDLLVIHALSSNHFNETQAMLKDFHKTVFPVLKNFTLVIYDLGLNEKELALLKKHCRCTVLKFPFDKLPTYFQTMKCFAWKIFAIAAHYEQANITMWTDASITTKNASAIPMLIERARSRGIVQRCNRGMTHNPFHTLPQMFESFGDSPCAHLSFRQCETGWGLYHNEPLIYHAVIKPWLACASNGYCICPVNQGAVQSCYTLHYHGIGICMRNDQSAISIILAKLFRENFDHFVHDINWFQRTDRGQRSGYFSELDRNQTVASKPAAPALPKVPKPASPVANSSKTATKDPNVAKSNDMKVTPKNVKTNTTKATTKTPLKKT